MTTGRFGVVARSLQFNGYGYMVELAEDGQRALDAVLRQRPDVMVLDMLMPQFDGVEVCRRLRSGGGDLSGLVLTARESGLDRVAGLDAGAEELRSRTALPRSISAERSRIWCWDDYVE